jgi:hypothetical protein
MKINKLHTLGQFVDIVGITDPDHEECYGNKDIFEEAKEKTQSMVVLIADKIIAYNKFLKQLKKEMFINEIIKPDENHPDYRYIEQDKKFNKERYKTNLKAWYEAEKKVIFEDVKQIDNKIHIDCIEGSFYIIFEENKIELFYKFDPTYSMTKGKIKNLSDLAEKTNGQLKLKGVEI